MCFDVLIRYLVRSLSDLLRRVVGCLIDSLVGWLVDLLTTLYMIIRLID